MADETQDRDRTDVTPDAERNRENGGGTPPEDAPEVAGDVDARRLEITPDRPDRPPSS